MATRASARASGAPGQVWMPRPKARCWRALARADVERRRVLEVARVAVGGAVEHHHRGAGREVDPAHRGRHPGQPEVALDRALEPQRSPRRSWGCGRARCAAAAGGRGCSAISMQRGAEQADGGLLAGGEEVGRDAHDVDDLGRRAVGEGGGGQAGQHVVAGLAAAVLDVAGERAVQVLQRRVRQLSSLVLPTPPPSPGRCCSASAKSSRSSSGTPSRSAMTSMVKGSAKPLDVLALAAGRGTCPSRPVGQLPHRRLVLLEALRGDQPHQQRRGGRCAPAGRASGAGR